MWEVLINKRVVIFVTLLIMVLAAQVIAYEKWKKVEWQVSKLNIPTSTSYILDGAYYKYNTHALAYDAHGQVQIDNPSQGNPDDKLEYVKWNGKKWVSEDVEYHCAVIGDQGKPTGHTIDTQHDVWSNKVQFSQFNGLSRVDIPGENSTPAKSTHAEADAHTYISCTVPVQRAAPGSSITNATPYYATAEVGVKGHAKTTGICFPDGIHPCPPPEPYAEAMSFGMVALKGAMNKEYFESTGGNGDEKKWKWTRQKTIKLSRGLTQCGNDHLEKLFDPITMDIYDEDTGELLEEQDIWAETFETSGTGAYINWDDITGLSLSAGIGSSARIAMGTLSDWVINQFNGTVTIIDGIFNATGDFAALPWIVNVSGNITSAILAPDVFSLDQEFLIEASGDGEALNDQIVDVRSDVSGFAVAPEPGSMISLLLGITGLCAVMNKKRIRQ